MGVSVETNGLMSASGSGLITADGSLFGYKLAFRPKSACKGNILVTITNAQGTAEHRWNFNELTNGKVLLDKTVSNNAPAYDSGTDKLLAKQGDTTPVQMSFEVQGKADFEIYSTEAGGRDDGYWKVAFSGSGHSVLETSNSDWDSSQG